MTFSRLRSRDDQVGDLVGAVALEDHEAHLVALAHLVDDAVGDFSTARRNDRRLAGGDVRARGLVDRDDGADAQESAHGPGDPADAPALAQVVQLVDREVEVRAGVDGPQASRRSPRRAGPAPAISAATSTWRAISPERVIGVHLGDVQVRHERAGGPGGVVGAREPAGEVQRQDGQPLPRPPAGTP